MKIATKKITLLTTIAMLIPLLTAAQSFSPGVKVGANLSTISTGLSSSNDWRVGFQAGVFGNIRLNDYTALQPELMYAQKGSRSNYDKEFLGGEVEEAIAEFNMSFINLPVLFNFRAMDRLNVFVGPYFSYLLKGEIDADPEILTYINAESNDDIDRDNFNDYDIGLQVGVGFDIKDFRLGFDYSFGFIPVAKNDDQLDKILEDSTNSTFQIYGGFVF